MVISLLSRASSLSVIAFIILAISAAINVILHYHFRYDINALIMAGAFVALILSINLVKWRRAIERRRISRVEDKIRRLINPYGQHLGSRYRALVHIDRFGNKEWKAWDREITRFAEAHVYYEMSPREREIYREIDGTDFIAWEVSRRWALPNPLDSDQHDPYSMRDPVQFEDWCAQQCMAAGWEAYTTQASNDFGADVIATGKGGATIVIQCKLYTGKVPIKAVQEVIGARSHYATQYAAVVTTSDFTKQAKMLAASSQVELLNAAGLKNYLDQIN